MIAPGQDTAYPISLGSFQLRAGTAVETLQSTADGVDVQITNDYPKSDGIHLFSTPTHSGQAFEFELFNPGGNLFDSTDSTASTARSVRSSSRRSAWDIQDGNQSMTINLDSVSMTDIKLAIRHQATDALREAPRIGRDFLPSDATFGPACRPAAFVAGMHLRQSIA